MDHKEYMKKYHRKNRSKHLASFKEYYEKNRATILAQKKNLYFQEGKRAYFKRKYKISLDDLNKMVESQNNECAICGKLMDGKSNRHLDHEHSTGKIRELLCGKCNRGLGYFKENTSTLQSAIHYLNKWREINRVCQSGYNAQNALNNS